MFDRSGDYFVEYSYSGEAISVEFLPYAPEDMWGVPCRSQIEAILDAYPDGELSVPDLISGDSKPIVLENAPGSASAQTGPPYIRYRSPEPVGYTIDLIGDGSEQVEYTEDGRALGMTIANWDRRVLVDSAVPFHREVSALLAAHGVIATDRVICLESISYGRVKGQGLMVSIQGYSHGGNEQKAEWIDIHGDGRVHARISDDGEYLIGARFTHLEVGVDLSGIPHRAEVEAILVHRGIEIKG